MRQISDKRVLIVAAHLNIPFIEMSRHLPAFNMILANACAAGTILKMIDLEHKRQPPI